MKPKVNNSVATAPSRSGMTTLCIPIRKVPFSVGGVKVACYESAKYLFEMHENASLAGISGTT
jgi:hypothetical protein